MLVRPQEVSVTNLLWITEKSSIYFLLQKRKGHGKARGLSSLFVGTLDSVFDTKPAPYRILHQTPSSDVYFEIACAVTSLEIERDWQWIFENISETLTSFDKENEVTDYVLCKIHAMVATTQEPVQIEDEDTKAFRATAEKFHKLFGIPAEEKLVNYYTCSYWKNTIPDRGRLYLTLSRLVFHSRGIFSLSQISIRWLDVSALIRKNDSITASLIFSNAIEIEITVRDGSRHIFSVCEDAVSLMEQLANHTMQGVIDDKTTFNEDKDLLKKLSKNIPKKASFLKRDFDARAQSANYRYRYL
ncbi:TBC1 domain family member 9-like [Ctenocephalides felis]|uniref:TBC1 domain family member 9-like n=1 Tax=Ctenocephalides felis TaxID=7515 RepID=UPI000E6E48D6|nr:TBC1 domain family member 9-like [Ctenocephalides felis]